MRTVPFALLAAGLALTAAPAVAATTVTLTFDDVGVLSGYAPLGVTFSANASIWTGGGGSVLVNPSGGPYSEPSALQFGSAGGVVGHIYFDVPVWDVSIWALSGPGPDLLSTPMYIKCYDGDGDFLGDDYADGTLQFDQLRVGVSGIRHIETYSPCVANDVWDDLVYTVPEPATLALAALGSLVVLVRRNRKQACPIPDRGIEPRESRCRHDGSTR